MVNLPAQPQQAATASWLLSAGLPSVRDLPVATSNAGSGARVALSVYYPRGVDFDENGRVVRRMGSDLTWANRLIKDALGMYHVGVQVFGDEYSFGTWRAPNSRRVGSSGSGVVRHDPRIAGPQFVFKEAVDLGSTAHARSQVEEVAAELGLSIFYEGSYNKVRLNCADFALALCMRLGVDEVPLWCYRGTAAARMFGIGGVASQDEDSDEDTVASPESKTQQARALGEVARPVTSSVYSSHLTTLETPPIPGAEVARPVASSAYSSHLTTLETPPIPGALPIGQPAWYLSRSSGQWLPAHVLGYNEEPAVGEQVAGGSGDRLWWSYRLDVQEQAAPSHVQPRVEEAFPGPSPSPSSSVLPAAAAGPERLLQRAPGHGQIPAVVAAEGAPPKALEPPTAGPERLLLQAPLHLPDTSAAALEGAQLQVSTPDRQPYQAGTTLTPERVPAHVGSATTLDSKRHPSMTTTAERLQSQGKPVQAKPLPVGAQVAYLSRSSGRWLQATVLGHRWLATTAGATEFFYQLDIQPDAEASRVVPWEQVTGVAAARLPVEPLVH